jgi:hypothetical protein
MRHPSTPVQVKRKDESAAGEEEERTVSIISSLLQNIAKQVRLAKLLSAMCWKCHRDASCRLALFSPLRFDQ